MPEGQLWLSGLATALGSSLPDWDHAGQTPEEWGGGGENDTTCEILSDCTSSNNGVMNHGRHTGM